MQGSRIGDDDGVELRGQLLIASPSLWDPNFRRAVVLARMRAASATVSEVSVHEAAPPFAALVVDDGVVFVGGPVQPQAAVVIADFNDPSQADLSAFGSIGFLPGEADPETVAGVRRARLFAGYAGWGPGQLEAEVEEGSWFLEPARPDDVFTVEPGALWSNVLRRKGPAYELVSLMPADPSLN